MFYNYSTLIYTHYKCSHSHEQLTIIKIDKNKHMTKVNILKTVTLSKSNQLLTRRNEYAICVHSRVENITISIIMNVLKYSIYCLTSFT